MKVLPIQPAKCATCPFRTGSQYARLAPTLAHSAINNASRICHSTGSRNAINHKTDKAPMLCRGARDIQLGFFAAIGFIEAATDEAWAKKLAKVYRQRKRKRSAKAVEAVTS